jgi:hypothetical protein
LTLRILNGLAVLVVTLTTGGCLLFTSVSDLGGGTAAGGSSDFNAPEVVAHDTPGTVGLAVDAANVYWANPTTGKLWRAPVTSANAAVLMAVDKPKTAAEIVIFNGRVFVASSVDQSAESGIFSYAPDGSSQKQEQDYGKVSRMVTADSIYASVDGSSNYDSAIRKISADRQVSIVLKTQDALATALAFDGQAVFFYIASSPRTIQRVAADGTAALFVQEDEVADLLADTTTLYALTVTGNLVAHPLAGGAPRVIASGLAGARRLAADDAAFYVSAAGLTPTGGRIVRIQKSDGAMHDLATNQASPGAIVAVPSGVFWVDSGDGAIMRALRR